MWLIAMADHLAITQISGVFMLQARGGFNARIGFRALEGVGSLAVVSSGIVHA